MGEEEAAVAASSSKQSRPWTDAIAQGSAGQLWASLVADERQSAESGSGAAMDESVQLQILELCKLEMPPALHQRVLVDLADVLIGRMGDPVLLIDFFMRSFDMGPPYNVLALGGLLLLVTKHDLEFPEFYGKVYELTRPSICYSMHKQRFFRLLNLMLSSSHVPAYVCGAFAKRLSQLALTAPADCQLPLQKLIRNVLIRYPPLSTMICGAGGQGEPYDRKAADPKLSNGQRSSLWEMAALQQHYYAPIGRHAGFVNKQLPAMESLLLWRSPEHAIGAELDRAVETGGDEEEETAERPQKKRRREDDQTKVPLTFERPTHLFSASVLDSFTV